MSAGILPQACTRAKKWSKDAGGNDSLATLAERGIGALYLGSVATPFSVKDAGNTLQGQVRASGVFTSTRTVQPTPCNR